jgi:hypothetical protein
MVYVAPDLLTKKSSPDQVGGMYSLQLAYSRNILQQRFQTDSEIVKPLKFLKANRYVTGWSGQYLKALISIEEIYDVGIIDENYTFSAYLDSFCSEEKFKVWWTKYLKGQRLALLMTDMNGFERILNPFIATYQYIGTQEYAEQNRYILTFGRVRILDNDLQHYRIIAQVTTTTISIGNIVSNDCTIVLFSDADYELFNFGYGASNDIAFADFQSNPQDNILYNIPDGTHWFFAQNILIPTLYDAVRAVVRAGEITVIIENSENPQIITENETIDDTGFVAPE